MPDYLVILYSIALIIQLSILFAIERTRHKEKRLEKALKDIKVYSQNANKIQDEHCMQYQLLQINSIVDSNI